MDKPPKKDQPTEFSEENPKDALAGNRPSDQSEDDLDFIVTEEGASSEPRVPGPNSGSDNDLGIESTADLMEQEASQRGQEKEFDFGEEPAPFGASPSSPADSNIGPHGPSGQDEVVGFTSNNQEPPEEPDRIEKLTEEQIQEIAQRMKRNEVTNEVNYLSDEEKMRLIKNLESATPSTDDEDRKGFDNAPIVPPKKQDQGKPTPGKTNTPSPAPGQYAQTPPNQSRPAVPPPPGASTPQPEPPAKPKLKEPPVAKRVRGLAYFHKKFIQITGEQELHEEDELVIAGREYVLRKKRLSNAMLIGIVAPIAAVIIFLIGAYFSSSAYSGEGSIVGVALDENSMPFLTGARVRLPELGKTYETNAQGFFRTDPIESGSQKIEYIIGDQIVATDFATVVDGKLTMVMLRPVEEEVAMNIPSEPDQPAQRAAATSTQQRSNSSRSQSSASKSSQGSRKSSSSSSSTKSRNKSSAPRYANLQLAANVDGAKLKMDGEVLGAGNLTYRKLAPGRHSYTVSKDGYAPVSGSVSLTAGKTSKLEVSLAALSTADKTETYRAEDFFYSGKAAIDEGDLDAAVTDLSQAIEMQPSYSAAYLKRAEAYEGLRYDDRAYDDYVRAAEIMAVKRDVNGAITAYNRAIEIDDKKVTGYLGRGRVYLSRGEEIAAVADFDMAVRIDKRSLAGYMGLGEARYNQGYFKKAARHFRDARTIEPENPRVHEYLMLSYLGAGDYKQVQRAYDDYRDYASPEDLARLESDPQFGAVLRVVDTD
ncbi:PEGA domain-containing protein [candidate division GN15 bacterium]|nr:PEGA domain-containing protein [candidate division GN15 bacterium]